MESSSPPPPPQQQQQQQQHHPATNQPQTGIGEAESSYQEEESSHRISRAKSPSPRPPSRPSSVLPRILESFSCSPAVTSSSKRQSPDKRGESPIIEIPLKSPTVHSDTYPSTPICGVPPFSPESERSSCGSTSGTAPQQFCLRWNNYQSNLTSVFDQLLQNESFVDVTLACDGRSIKAHKMVLSACSPYFQTLFSTTPCQHPIVIMRDVTWFELRSIVDFMYKGEINVSQEQIGPLLRIAEMLKVRGLADVGNIGAAGSTAQISTKQDEPITRDVHSRQSLTTESPKRKETMTSSPQTNRPPSQSHAHDHDSDRDPKLLIETEKKDHWEPSGFGKQTESSNLEYRLSPVPQQHLLGRNIRKRRWPSADAIFNPPESPLSSLIAAERAEQERERERARERDRDREKSREISLLTPPMPVTSSGASGQTSNLSSCVSTSVLDSNVHMDITSPSPTPTPTLLPPARTPSGMLTPSPHLQMSHHHSHSHQLGSHQTHQAHQSHRSSPASSVTSTHPSSVLSRPLTPSPVSVGHSTAGSRLESSQLTTGDSHRFPLGPAQAAAMAAAAAQMDLGGASSAMSIRPHQPVSSGPGSGHHSSSLVDDLEIKPGIAEMIREEERAKMLENSHAWMGASGSSIADSYQYQLQSMWQKCWNTNQSLMHHLRFRERGPLKSWRPETMAEAIFSVLKEGLSLSQAARKYDIPYPTFVLYANRVHNMLGPSIDGGPDLRPKGRGRPQRILLGIWPDEHIKGVIKTVVFRDAKDLKDEGLTHMPYGRHSPVFSFQDAPITYPGVSAQCPNGMPGAAGEQMSQEATAAAVAAVAHNLRQQMQMAAAAQQQQLGDTHSTPNLFNLPPHLASGGPLSGPPGPVGVPLPKASISPALSSSSNTGGVGSMMGSRHVPSPCGPNLPGMHQLPPGMAAALHMASSGHSGRCDPNTMLTQQQQHQLQQLHLQQQHALQQQQQQKHQQQQHQMGYGSHTQSLGHSSMAGTHHTHAIVQQSMQKTTTTSSTKTTSSRSSPPSMRTSPHSITPLHSPLTELGLEMSFKPSRPFSPSRLFSDDISDIVGVAGSPLRSSPSLTISSSSAMTTSTITTTNSITTSTAGATTSEPPTSSTSIMMATASGSTLSTNASATSNLSSTGIKLEPITTSSD